MGLTGPVFTCPHKRLTLALGTNLTNFSLQFRT